MCHVFLYSHGVHILCQTCFPLLLGPSHWPSAYNPHFLCFIQQTAFCPSYVSKPSQSSLPHFNREVLHSIHIAQLRTRLPILPFNTYHVSQHFAVTSLLDIHQSVCQCPCFCSIKKQISHKFHKPFLWSSGLCYSSPLS